MKLTILALAAVVTVASLTTGRLREPGPDEAPRARFDVGLVATVEITRDSSSLLLVGWVRNPRPGIGRRPGESISIQSVHRPAMALLRFTLHEVLGIPRGED